MATTDEKKRIEVTNILFRKRNFTNNTFSINRGKQKYRIPDGQELYDVFLSFKAKYFQYKTKFFVLKNNAEIEEYLGTFKNNLTDWKCDIYERLEKFQNYDDLSSFIKELQNRCEFICMKEYNNHIGNLMNYFEKISDPEAFAELKALIGFEQINEDK